MTQSIGEKIKKLREDSNISAEDFAARASISKEQLMLIESSEVVPSMAILTKIVRVLGVRLGTILDGMEQTGPVITRADNQSRRIRLSSDNASSREHLDFFPLAEGKPDRSMEPFIIEVNCPADKNPQKSNHEGEEFIYVLEGEITLIYGAESYSLQSGDSIYYDSIVPHSLFAKTPAGAKILAVVYVPV